MTYRPFPDRERALRQLARHYPDPPGLRDPYAYEPRIERVSDQPPPPELDWYYGPTDWDSDPGKMWHRDCPGGRGEVWLWKDGSASCSACEAVQPPDEDSPYHSTTDPEEGWPWAAPPSTSRRHSP